MRNYDALKQNLIDVIQEFQIKLGCCDTSISLFYPLSSLNDLLNTHLSADAMQTALNEFSAAQRDLFGIISCTHEEDRFTLRISREGVAQAGRLAGDNPFLRDFIAQIQQHPCRIEDLIAVMKRYSDQVVCQPMRCDDFDYLLFFADGRPDAYRYCVKFEGPHAVYHRFTKRDYEAFAFEA